jgi:hypothetical protein
LRDLSIDICHAKPSSKPSGSKPSGLVNRRPPPGGRLWTIADYFIKAFAETN